MNLHQAEFIAGELLAFTGAAVGITGAWLQYQRKQVKHQKDAITVTEGGVIRCDAVGTIISGENLPPVNCPACLAELAARTTEYSSLNDD